ncbi:MAG TPA: aminotransferase class I/II-fold pyridoxal phosphate-dependent enzyme [Gemmatimonadaceae bacterium]|jgi:pyridoxal phosphate-dependent aminotransferase EpsN
MSGLEEQFVAEAFASNWIAPLGPQVDAFQDEFAAAVGSGYATALSSGTAAIHLALIMAGVGPGDDVFASTLTFSASINPIAYVGARPVFIDSEAQSWNMDPAILADALEKRAAAGRLPKAVIVVHLYGQCADMDPIITICSRHGVTLIEDAAEALGSTYKGKSAGTMGKSGIFSFNGNKIITTSGGGMLVSDDEALIAGAHKLATQAREPAPHYQHSEIGYNYRMSNLLAAVGRGQLRVLEDRVQARRANFDFYARELASFSGITLMPEAPWGRHNRWLTTMTVDPSAFGATRETIRLALEAVNIEARPVWKPMHLQPVFASSPSFGGEVAAGLFEHGLCLPSGSNLTTADLTRVVSVIADVHAAAPAHAGA